MTGGHTVWRGIFHTIVSSRPGLTRLDGHEGSSSVGGQAMNIRRLQRAEEPQEVATRQTTRHQTRPDDQLADILSNVAVLEELWKPCHCIRP